MKRAIIGLLLLAASPIFSNEISNTEVLTQVAVQPVPQKNQEELAAEKAHRLNLLLQQELRHLDSIVDILQYFGQAINKGSIAVEDKRVVSSWIAHHQKAVRSIEVCLENLGKKDETALDEGHLIFYANTIQMLCYHLQHAITHKLTILNDFALHRSPYIDGNSCTINQVEQKINKNQESIESLRLDANNLGLTTVNLLARELDAINSDYKIIERAELILGGLAIGAIGLYLLKETLIVKERVDGTPVAYTIPAFIAKPILRAKSWLGEKPQYGMDKEVSNGPKLGFMGSLDATFKESKELIAGVGYVSWRIYGQKFNRASREFTNKMRRWWSGMKGFTVEPDQAHYKIYEDLTLDDERLVGLETQKEILRDIAHYVLDPEVFDRTNSSPAKSILLTGPSGSGKTLLARALSGTINGGLKNKGKKNKFAFKEVQHSEVLGWGDDGLAMLLEEAKANAPCIIFWDELHNLPLQTAAHGGNKFLTAFLTEMDGLRSNTDANHQVIFIAATNKPELLDPALLRSGRFGDNVIRCERPNLDNRKKYFNVMFERNSVDTSSLDIDDLAEQTEGSTFSELDGILREASFKARTLAQRVKPGHIQKKIDSHIYRINKNMILKPSDRAIMAAHIAGTTLMHMLPNTKTECMFKLATTCGISPKVVEKRVWASTTPTNEKEAVFKYGKVFTYNPKENSGLNSLEDLLKSAKIKLAGAFSERILMGTPSSIYKNSSRKKALLLIKKYLLNGLDEQDLPKNEKEKVNSEALAHLSAFEVEVQETLTQHKSTLEKIAKALELQATVSDKEVAQIMQNSTAT